MRHDGGLVKGDLGRRAGFDEELAINIAEGAITGDMLAGEVSPVVASLGNALPGYRVTVVDQVGARWQRLYHLGSRT